MNYSNCMCALNISKNKFIFTGFILSAFISQGITPKGTALEDKRTMLSLSTTALVPESALCVWIHSRIISHVVNFLDQFLTMNKVNRKAASRHQEEQPGRDQRNHQQKPHFSVRERKCNTVKPLYNGHPLPQGFSLPPGLFHFLSERPWGRGCTTVILGKWQRESKETVKYRMIAIYRSTLQKT